MGSFPTWNEIAAAAPALAAYVASEGDDPEMGYLRLQMMALSVLPHLEPLEAFMPHPAVDKTVIDPRTSQMALFSAGAPSLSRITFLNGSKGAVWFGSGCSLKNVLVNATGGIALLAFGPHCELSDCVLTVRGKPGAIIFGSGTTGTVLNVLVGETGDYVAVGDDCMFSNNVAIRTTDSHAILDTRTGLRINPSKPVLLHRHVWISRQVNLNKGVEVGPDAIVGQGSTANGSLKAGAIHAGIPAKMLREQVTWDRTLAATIEEAKTIAPHRTRQLKHVRACADLDALAGTPLGALPPKHALSRILAVGTPEDLISRYVEAAGEQRADLAVLCRDAHVLRVASARRAAGLQPAL